LQNEMKTLYPDEPAPNLSGLNQQDQATIFNFRKQKAMEAQAAKKQEAENAYKLFSTTVDLANKASGPTQKYLFMKGIPPAIEKLKQFGYFQEFDAKEFMETMNVAEEKAVVKLVKELAGIDKDIKETRITKDTGADLTTKAYAKFLSEAKQEEVTIGEKEVDRMRKSLEPPKPETIKALTESDLIRQSLVDRLGREPTAQELLDAAQQRKAEIAREGRSNAMQTTFVDPETGNPLIFDRLTNSYKVSKVQGNGGIALRPVNPSGTEREKTAALEALSSQIDRIEASYKPEYVGLISGQVGRITQLTDPEEAGFRQLISDVKDSLLRSRSGASINEQEYQRLSRLVPDYTDSEAQFKGKMKSFKTSMNNIQEGRKEAQRKGGVKFTKTDGQTPAVPTSKFKILKVE